MSKNIALTTLSKYSPYTDQTDKSKKYYYLNYYVADGEKLCSGVQQQEPGAKYFFSQHDIDKIVIVGSEETFCADDEELFSTELSNWVGKITEANRGTISTLRLFVYRMADFVYGTDSDALFDVKHPEVTRGSYTMATPVTKKEVEVRFVPDRKDSSDNYKELIRELRGTKEQNSNLYMDMQGGQRTAIYMNNALLQMLGEQGNVYFTELKQVVATDYLASRAINRVVDETDRYRILDLVSGMNAFIKYGKADTLVEYLEKLSGGTFFDKNVSELTTAMKKVDDAITLSRFTEDSNSENGGMSLLPALNELKRAVAGIELEQVTDGPVKNIFSILLEGIKSDMGALLEGDRIDIPALVKWRLKKNDYISAATIAETYMPRYFVEHKVLYYADNAADIERAKQYMQLYYYLAEKDEYKYDDFNHFFISYYPYRTAVKYNNGSLQKKLELPIKVITLPGLEKEVAEVISNYKTVSTERNKLAHADGSGSPDKIKRTIKSLLEKLKQFESNTNDYMIDKVSFNNNVMEETLDKYSWKNLSELCQNELDDECALGCFDLLFSVQDIGWAKKNQDDAYALSFLFDSIKTLEASFDKLRDSLAKEKVDFLRKNFKLPLFRVLVDKYNRDNGTSLDFSDIVKKNYTVSEPTEVTEKKAVEYIISEWKRLDTDEVYETASKILSSKETWMNHVREVQKMLSENADLDASNVETRKNIELIEGIFAPLLKSKNAWRDIIRYYIQDKERMLVLYEDKPQYVKLMNGDIKKGNTNEKNNNKRNNIK